MLPASPPPIVAHAPGPTQWEYTVVEAYGINAGPTQEFLGLRSEPTAKYLNKLGAEGWVVWPLPRQGSHVLTSMLAADCLAFFPSATAKVAAGETVEVELLDRANLGR